MNSNDYDVIVIGVGAMGSAACWRLADRGARVLGLEQFDIPHARGSSHGYSRMIRLAYHEHPDYVPLLRRAYELWDELQRISGQPLLHITGGAHAGPGNSEQLRQIEATAQAHQLPYERFDAAELARRFPGFQMPADYEVIFEPTAGFLRPEATISAQAIQALSAGARIQAHEPVVRWRAAANGIFIETTRGEYRCQKAIVCGGAWSQQLLASLNVPLRVTRQAQGWVWPRRPELFQLGRFPVWSVALEDGSCYYGFPMLGDVPGFKTAHHKRADETTADAVDRNPRPEDEADFRGAFRFLPDADGPLLGIRICMYTNTPDGHFVVDRHPEDERIVLACGFSGHGFKFASVIGEILSELALDGRTQHPARFLGLRRFM